MKECIRGGACIPHLHTNELFSRGKHLKAQLRSVLLIRSSFLWGPQNKLPVSDSQLSQF